MMTTRVLKLLVLGSVASVQACASRQSRDYAFGITGVVTAEDGTPLQGAEVILKVNGQVYVGVEPLKTERCLTNSTGGFVFMHNSHERGVKYDVTVRKEGFEPQTVSGNVPPAGHHTIRLKKVIGVSGRSRG
jgi:hypothetical protein